MIAPPSFLLLFCVIIDAAHFNGGTIRWEPINPYDNSSSVQIAIIQSYSWTYPTIVCATNVPISTSGRSSANANLTCITDCSTDGGYSTKPVNILTDCVSVSSSLTMMTSQRSVNITLTAGAHFYISYIGSAWRAVNDPPTSGLQWSITCFIDLRTRDDGFINTPPEANVVSPQYAIVNQSTQIQIPVSDANADDDVRCRWSTYTAGYRKRRQSNEDSHLRSAINTYKKVVAEEFVLIRKRRYALASCNKICSGTCKLSCPCSCPACSGAVCSGANCTLSPSCPLATTTLETPGTIATTTSYPHRNAIDECGGICYPSSVPSGTTLSNCTLSFIGLVANTWYAIAIQVEDFINETSTTPMSSVPVQFLIYVMPQPTCSISPVIISLTGCLEVSVGVSTSFNLSAMNSCDPNDANVTDIVVSSGIDGMQVSNLSDSSTNASFSYVTFTWTPEASQIGPQELCTVAYTSEHVQSAQYCVTFSVTTLSAICITTTTTTTTASTTSTTTSTTTSETTTTTTSTTTTVSTTTSVTTTTTTSTVTTSTTASTTTSVTTTTTSSTTSTTRTTTSTTTTITSSTTTTSYTTSTTTPASTKSTTESTNDLSLGLGLGLGMGLGLGLPLLLLVGALTTCLCCRWCPGGFWRNLRQRFWEEDEAFCELCRQRCVCHGHKNSINMFDEPPWQCQRQYISENPSTPTRPSFRDDSFLFGSFSPFDMPSMTTTQTTLMSSLSDSFMPSEEVSMQKMRAIRPSYPSLGGSILVRAYAHQETKGNIFSN